MDEFEGSSLRWHEFDWVLNGPVEVFYACEIGILTWCEIILGQHLFFTTWFCSSLESFMTSKISFVTYSFIFLYRIFFFCLGKLYNIISHKSLMQSMESIAQKIMVSGVIIDFEKTGPDPDPVSEGIVVKDLILVFLIWKKL